MAPIKSSDTITDLSPEEFQIVVKSRQKKFYKKPLWILAIILAVVITVFAIRDITYLIIGKQPPGQVVAPQAQTPESVAVIKEMADAAVTYSNVGQRRAKKGEFCGGVTGYACENGLKCEAQMGEANQNVVGGVCR